MGAAGRIRPALLALAGAFAAGIALAAEPEPGTAVIDGQRFPVETTAADRPDLEPHILPEMAQKCRDASRRVLEIAAAETFDAGQARFQHAAAASNCARLAEIMIGEPGRAAVQSLMAEVLNAITPLMYGPAAPEGARERALERMRSAHFGQGAVLVHPEDLGAAAGDGAADAAAADASPPPGRVRIDGALYGFALAEDAPAFMRESLLPRMLADCQSKGRDLLELAGGDQPDRRKVYGNFGAVAVACSNLADQIADDAGFDAFEAMIEAVRDDLFVYTGDEPGGDAALARAVARMRAAGFDRAVVAVNPADLPPAGG